MEPRPKKLLDQVRDAIRLKHYSYRTEQSYVAWIRRYILFHNKQHPQEMGVADIEAFLSHLAVSEQVSASTQNQALCVLTKTEGTRNESIPKCPIHTSQKMGYSKKSKICVRCSAGGDHAPEI
ncbi:phage integrase N-terminal SAM-like domain-containing protein [Phormidesmis sp. 146-35]